MKNTVRNIRIVLIAVIMIMMVTSSAFAAGNAGWYNPGTPVTYTNPIKVKVVLQSRKYANTSEYINAVYDVTLGTNNMTATSFKVIDALVALNDQQSDYVLLESSGDEIEETDSVLYNVKKVSNNHLYGPTLYTSDHYPIDGWMFKVNGKFPTSTSSSTNAEGLDVSHTYIQDGDVIYFFTDYPWKENNVIKSAYFVSAFTSYNDDTHKLKITLKQNRDFYNGPLATATWTIQMYGVYEPSIDLEAVVKDASGNLVGTVDLVEGEGTLTCNLNSSTNYYVSVMDDIRSFHSISGLDYSGNSISVNHLQRTIAYDKVEH
jgi:hypothetical protein